MYLNLLNARRERVLRLFEILKENEGKPCSKSLALFAIETGLTTACVREYYEQLKEAELIVENELDKDGGRDKGSVPANQHRNSSPRGRNNKRPAGSSKAIKINKKNNRDK